MNVRDIPLDGKPSNSGLLGQNVATNLLNHRLAGRTLCQRLIRVFVIDIVSHTHKLASIIAASQQDDSDTDDFRAWNVGSVGWIGFEDEFVRSRWDGADEEGIELLIVFGTT